MLQKIRKNKFLKKTLVFASVFLILTVSIVLPCFAQAPSIEVDDSSAELTLYSQYYNHGVNYEGEKELIFIVFEHYGTVYPIICEAFFTTYGFSISDNALSIYYDIESNYYSSDSFRCYSPYDDEEGGTSLYSAIQDFAGYSSEAFVTFWNNQFNWEITKNNEVYTLTQQNNTLTQQNNTLNNDIAAKNEQISSLQQGIENANRQYQTLSGQYDDLNSAYSDLQSNYNTLNQNYSALQSSNNTLQSDYNTLQYNYTNLNNDYNTLQVEYDYLLEDYLIANSQGYTQALNDMNAFRKGLFDIFNAPFEFVRNLTGAEIFGINIFGIFCFFFVFMLGLFLFSILRGLIF